jgi:hypothetical protein
MSTQEATVSEGDIFALTHIDPEVLAVELECFSLKWFDYRHLHPAQATQYFGRIFNKIRAEVHGREIDESESKWMARYAHSFRLDTQSPRNIKGFWRARQVADLIGMKYEVFCRAAINYLRSQRSWSRIPSPSQLYSKEVTQACVTAWEHELKAQIMHPRSKLLMADSEAWFKPEFDQWYIKQIRERSNWRELLANAVREGILTVQSIKEKMQ